MGIGNSNETLTTGISRRTVTKGIAWATPAVAAAWAAPTVTAAAAAPAYSSSPIPPNGLNGWVELQKSCRLITTSRLRIDGYGNYPDRGLWTFVPDPEATITGATITFFFNSANLSFSNQSQPGWTDLVRNSALDASRPASGFYAYTTTYTGTWTYVSTMQGPAGTPPGGWSADGDPRFTHTYGSYNACANRVQAYARRSITVNGETVTFTRGPITA